MQKTSRTYAPSNRNWSTIYVTLETKKMINDLCLYSESYESAIKRLIAKRTFDVVNGEVIKLDGDINDKVSVKFVEKV